MGKIADSGAENRGYGNHRSKETELGVEKCSGVECGLKLFVRSSTAEAV